MHVRLTDGKEVACEQVPFKEGAEGTLYLSKDGMSVVKLYRTPGQWRRAAVTEIVRKNITHGDTTWSQLLCWPQAVVDKPLLGILMPRVEPGLRELSWYTRRKAMEARIPPEERGTWAHRIALGIKIARAIRRLHQAGFAHSDLSDNNFLVDPRDGRVVVIDLDGLVVPGRLQASVLGTSEFMAPEIVTGQAGPSTTADLHALAVVLYKLLLLRHPLKGPKRYPGDADQEDRRAMGEDALFIEHPVDRSNRPAKLNSTITSLGDSLEKLFVKALVEGLHRPDTRPIAAQWEDGLLQTADRVVPCMNSACQNQAFVFTGRPDCPWCGHRLSRLRSIPVLHLQWPQVGQRRSFYEAGERTVVGWPGSHLYLWHAIPGLAPEPGMSTKPIATFAYSEREHEWTLHVRHEKGFFTFEGGTEQAKPAAFGSHIVLRQDMHILLGDAYERRRARVQLCAL